MIDLDHKYPILLFPIRIETKYHQSSDDGTRSLRIRFYPDQIIINNFDPRLTRKELEDARDYWRIISKLNRANVDQFNQDRNSAWTKLVNQHGLPRSAFITKAVISYDPKSEPDPVTPTLKADEVIEKRMEDDYLSPSCKLLPNRFIVYGKFKDPALGVLEPAPIGKNIPEPLLLDFLQEDFLQNRVNTDVLPSWITDFNEAVEKGMAIEIKLKDQEYKSGFEYIIAYGVRENLSPEQTERELETLFHAHKYGQGLSFVKQGTPTNLSKLKSKDGQSFFSPHSHAQTDITSYRSMEFSALPDGHAGLLTEQQSDGRIFEIALGIENVANGLLNANNHDQATATYMSFVLWSSVLNYFMNTFLNIPSLHLAGLQKHFVRYVSGQGIVPSIRVGKTPYGILPVTILSEWEDEHIISGTHFIRTFFTTLKSKLLEPKSGFIDQVPTAMKSKTGGIPPAENLLNILSMEAISHAYYVRGYRSLDFIADFSFDILKRKTANGMPITKFTYDQLRNRTRQELELHLDSIFLPENYPTPLKEALKNFYNLCPGAGISSIEYPMVNVPEESDSLFPNYIEKIYNDIMGQDRNFFKTTKKQIEIPDFAPSDSDPLLFRLLRYSASIIGQSNDQKEIETFAESLKFLLDRDLKPDRLRALMFQTLDLVSYRLDAWISSFANQRLDHLRRNQDKGLYAGAFGWVENLMPKELDEGLTKNSVRAGGYIHAPSYAHAAAAAVLRNGYLIHSNEFEKKDLLKINLNSERTKNALDIIDSIKNIPLSELLGYWLERRLHDAKIDYIIDEFRKYFPLNKDDRKELKDATESGQERIIPRNLTDGFSVFKNWKRLIDKIPPASDFETIEKYFEAIENFMKTDDTGWKSFYSEIKNKYADDNGKMFNFFNNQLKPQLNFLLDQMDGLSDLCIAESVFQAVSGNYLRSGAVLDGMSGEGQIPIPEISAIPRSGLRQIQRIALALEVPPLRALNLQDVKDSVPWTSPKKLAEPNFNKLVTSYLGDIRFWVDLRDTSGIVTSSEELGLNELGLEAIDLLYIENSELELRLNFYAKNRGFSNYSIRYEQEESSPAAIEKKSLRDLQLMIKALRGMLVQGHALKYSDFISPNEMIQGKRIVDSIKEVFQRYYDIILLLVQTLKELESVKSDDTEGGIENKRRALMKAGMFASEYAVPLDREGSIITSGPELEEKIIEAIKVLTLRLPHGDDQVAKLSSWRASLQTTNEEEFLESLADELSGEPENEMKYFKTIDALVDQVKNTLNNNSFLILPPFSISTDTGSFANLKSSAQINRKLLKWIEKASYVRPRLRFLEETITYNHILESADFSFYRDETKFIESAENLASTEEDPNPVSIILVVSTKIGEQEKNGPPSNLAGVVVDEWTDKIVSKEQDTFITFHYDGPNSEAPQSLLLAVSPNDQHRWNEDRLLQVILETFELMKLRAVDYRSLKVFRHFLPTLLLNSNGEDIYINLFQGKSSE